MECTDGTECTRKCSKAERVRYCSEKSLPVFKTAAQDRIEQLEARNKELVEALEGLLKDLERRAEIYSDGTKVLFCGNGVLFKADEALALAKGESNAEAN